MYYFNAYQDLSTCRLFEGGFIPWTAVREYVITFGGGIDDVEFMSRYCHILDDMVYTDAKAKENKSDASAKPRKRKRIIGEKDGTAKG